MSEPLYRPFNPPEPSRTFSLFWKVLVVIIMTAVLATIAIGLYLRHSVYNIYSDDITRQLQSYVELVAAGIGVPPDPAKVAYFAERYPLDIRVERGGEVWASKEVLPSAAELAKADRLRSIAGLTAFDLRERDGQFYGVLEQDGYVYILHFHIVRGKGASFISTIVLIVVLFCLFGAAYASVRFFLRPVNELMDGVKAIGSANFKYRVPVRSYDELGTLTSAFNAMSEQIEEIIASKRRLLFDVSHELRSPLTRMNIAIVMLPESKTRDKLQRNANELNTMITELLENERLSVLGGALVVEHLNLVELARKVVESFTDEDDRLAFDTLTESLEMEGDVQRLIVALRNIVSNALKYSDTSSQPVRVSVFPDDDGARIVVKDHGIGIPEESLYKIFEPFYRTDESRTRATGGYGLGLALTKSIIEAHGGTIHAESKEGEGTSITIWLPIVPKKGAVRSSIGSGSAVAG